MRPVGPAIIGILGVVAVLATPVLAQPAVPEPDFRHYPALPIQVGVHARPRLTDAQSGLFRTALRQASTRPINFAGHFIVAEIGCGTSCVLAAAIDARTGTVVWFPGSISSWPDSVREPIDYRADSRLFVVHGRINETGPAVTRRLLLQGRSFVRLPNRS